MSHKCSLSTQTGKIWLVIRKNQPIDLKLFQLWLDKFTDRYAYITHENDFNPVDGTKESIHYHCVCDLKAEYKDRRLSTTLNSLVDALELNDGIGIQIEKYDMFEKCLQYLTHKNNPEKTQHGKKEIVHNLPSKEFELFYNLETSVGLTFDNIYSCCLNHTNKLGVIRELYGYYSKSCTYMKLIDSIWDLVQKGNSIHIDMERQDDYH